MRAKLKKNESDSKLYPLFIGFGLATVTFGTLNMGIGTDKVYAMVTNELQNLSKSIVESAQGIVKSADGAATGIQGFAASAVLGCAGYIFNIFKKNK